MHVLPLIALASARMFGGRSLIPVRASALLFTGLVAFTFVQALMGRPFLGGTGLSFGPGIATGVQGQEG